MTIPKPYLTFWLIWNMNFGFFGIQYSFGLQQSNMSPIYKYLGAEEASLPYLWLAGPMTGLINGRIGVFCNFIAFVGDKILCYRSEKRLTPSPSPHGEGVQHIGAEVQSCTTDEYVSSTVEYFLLSGL